MFDNAGKAVYKLYKKTGEMVKDAFPKFHMSYGYFNLISNIDWIKSNNTTTSSIIWIH